MQHMAKSNGRNRLERLCVEQLPWSVLAQALDDAGLLPSNGPPRGIRSTGGPLDWFQKRDLRERARDREEAIRFLTDATGPWADARTLWCDTIGLDPDVLRERVVAMLAQARAERFARVRTRVRPKPVHDPFVAAVAHAGRVVSAKAEAAGAHDQAEHIRNVVAAAVQGDLEPFRAIARAIAAHA